MAENFPKLMTDTKLQIEKTWNTNQNKYPEISTFRYIIFKPWKTKEKILKKKKATPPPKKSPYLKRIKNKNYIRLLFRNPPSKKRMK